MKRKLLTIAAGMSLSIAVFAIIIWIGGLGEASWICSHDIDGWLRGMLARPPATDSTRKRPLLRLWLRSPRERGTMPRVWQ